MEPEAPQAVNGNTIVRIRDSYEQTTSAGLIIPATTKEPKVKYGEVVSCSPDKDYGIDFKVGDIVAVPTYNTDSMENGFHILSTANVLAVIERR